MLGVEVSPDAVRSAERTAPGAARAGTRTSGTSSSGSATPPTSARSTATCCGPDVRRSSSTRPAAASAPTWRAWLEQSGAAHVIYSSCNVGSLARDLARLPSYVTRRARLFDMFPQTSHHEVIVLLERR